MLAFINCNTYLGGGETLFVRIACRLQDINIPFKLLYLENSYISRDLRSKNICSEHLSPISSDADYYYLSDNRKEKLLNELKSKLSPCDNIVFVTFCLRDLYTVIALREKIPSLKIVHLILHDEDNLFLSQSITDKLLMKCLHIKRHSRSNIIDINNQILCRLNQAHALIGEKETSRIVFSKYGIDIHRSMIVPPPMYDFPLEKPSVPFGKKILWIGRFVDFKLPAIVSMLEFINTHQDYSLTLVGDGDLNYIQRVVQKKKLDISKVSFLGEISYEKLGDIIVKHNIGYACGTSIAEIARYGLPVIVALFSPNRKLFKAPICGGIYDNRKYKGNEGNALLVGEKETEQPLLDVVIKRVESKFDVEANNTFVKVRDDFGFTQNLNRYLEIFQNAELADFSSLKLPKCNWLRRKMFNYLKHRT